MKSEKYGDGEKKTRIFPMYDIVYGC